MFFTASMAMKTLRLAHIEETFVVLRRLMDALGDIFYLKKYMFVNLLSWILAGHKLLICLHYFACGWIYIYYWKSRHDYV